MISRQIAAWGGMVASLLILTTAVEAKEMRSEYVKARAAEEKLLEKAQAEKKAALAAERESKAKITKDRQSLKQASAELQARNESIQKEAAALSARVEELGEREKELTARRAAMDGTLRELVGAVRIFAKDMDELIGRNPQSVLNPSGNAPWKEMAAQNHMPGMEAIRSMTDRLFQEIQSSGEVSLSRGPIVDRNGKEISAEILMLGAFTAAYRTEKEIGFLDYTPGGSRLFALSQLPARSMRNALRRYMEGKSEGVPMDISRGGALRQLTHRLSLWDQILAGGMIVWPILAIFAVGVTIMVERVIFLLRHRVDADELIRRVAKPVQEGLWEASRTVCLHYTRYPVGRVMAAGLGCCDLAREEMENAVQEAILREIPPMERFLSTLGMLAAVAPLLGLLGTVTGMIETFHVITLYGTGDPRLMSGGISEALVTTMLGLSVAIPILLAHTLLTRTVETRIGELEEKALALINLILKGRLVP